MLPLHRHQLVHLHDDGWRRVLARDWDEALQPCIAHWAGQRLPLVVTRQSPSLPAQAIGVGLPAPARWGRRRIALQIDRADVSFFDEFPQLDAVSEQIALGARDAWQGLCAALAGAGARARVYGSHGWQHLSGLRYLHSDSDIDVWVAVADADQADRVTAALHGFSSAARPRIDGELSFPDGGAYAWREWQAWREGRCARVLRKTLDGPLLIGDPGSVRVVREAMLP